MTGATDRVYFLDWLRIGALGLLILYHADLHYVMRTWVAISPHQVDGHSLVGEFIHGWQMALLFLVAGAAMRFSVSREGPSSALAGRILRIGFPILFGLTILSPVQAFGANAAGLDIRELAEGHQVLQHVWFLPFLLLYVTLAAALVLLAPRFDLRLRALAKAIDRFGLALIVPVSILAVAAVVGVQFSRSYLIWSDLAGHLKYGGLFAIGFFCSAFLWARLEKLRYAALALVGISMAARLAVDAHAHQTLASVFAAVFGGAMIALLCGFGRRWFNANSPLLRMLNRAVMPIYLLHQSVVVGLMLILAPLGWPEAIERSALVALTAALSWFGYRALDAGPWRTFAGLSPAPAERATPAGVCVGPTSAVARIAQ
jgi:uncharacterized membrane protein YeiH